MQFESVCCCNLDIHVLLLGAVGQAHEVGEGDDPRAVLVGTQPVERPRLQD